MQGVESKLQALLEGSNTEDGQKLRDEIESQEAEHQARIRELEAQLERLEKRGESEGEAEDPHLLQEAALRQQQRGGDLDFIKQAAYQQQMHELDSKMSTEWAQRTRNFGRTGGGTACAIQ